MGAPKHLVLLACLLAYAAPSLAQESAIPCDAEPTDMAIAYGNLLEGANCTLTTSDVDLYRFPAQAGERALIRLTNLTGGRTICMEVFVGNTSLGPEQCSNDVNQLDLDVATTGTYTLLVSETLNRALGYALVLERNKPTSPSIVAIQNQIVQQGAIDSFGDIDFFVFNGAANDQVQIDLTNLTGGRTICAQLLGPDFETTSNGSLTCDNAILQLNQTLAASGVHTIQVNETLGRNMDYSLGIACLFGTCQTIIDQGACRADINDDNVVNFLDLGVLRSEFFQFCID